MYEGRNGKIVYSVPIASSTWLGLDQGEAISQGERQFALAPAWPRSVSEIGANGLALRRYSPT